MSRLFQTTSRRVTPQELAELELFEGIPEEALEDLAEHFFETEIPSQKVVFGEGEAAESFFLVTAGALAAYRDAPGQPIQLLARLYRHDFFGELGLVGGQGKYGASVRAMEPSRVLRVDRERFSQLIENHTSIQLKLQMVAARRYSQGMSTVLDLGRRREVRIRCSRPMAVELDDGSRHSIVLENLSLGGLCLDGAPSFWQPDTEHRFSLVLREGMLPLRGVVKWRQKGRVGVAFNSQTANHDTLLQMAIRLMLESPT